MRKSIIISLILFSLSSCHSGDEQQVVIVENKYSISIPSFLTKVNNLNDDASLQYQHAGKDFYIIVIDEPKSEFQKALIDNNLNRLYNDDIKGYSTLVINGFEETISVSQRNEPIDTLVNNMPARLLTISGRIEGDNVFCSFAFIEGEDRYYQIMAWTLLNKEYQYKDKMNQAMYSLTEF